MVWEKVMDANDKPRNPARRRAITVAVASAAAGIAAGFAGGVGLMATAPQPAAVSINGARRYDGKVVVITGATSGIGRAAALAFAREGGKVAFCGRRQALGLSLEREIKAEGGNALYIPADIRIEESVKNFIRQAAEAYGGIDIALNNAGITIEKPMHEFTSAEWDDVVNTNLRGVFLAMKFEIPRMLERGGGTILVTSSSVANSASERRSVYTASKAGLIGLVRSAALDYGSQGIRINAILPGTTDTAFVRSVAGMENMPDAAWKIGSSQWGQSNVKGLKRMATAQEIASFAVAMASPELTYLTGASLTADGGGGTG